MKNNIQLSDFDFKFKSSGHYTVTYTSPVTRKYWSCMVTDMTIIDRTKNADEYPLKKDLVHLKKLCKKGNTL